jgi:glycosyltransferase involved in cell wall biosynthesis
VTETKRLVSVIIPFHTREQFFREAIESVLRQTYTDWELFLVDDGATVGRSTEIALAYARQSPGKIIYLEHPGHQNRGLTRTRNLGAENSRGEYLAFLDSDDVWLPEKLEQCVSLLETHPTAGCVYGPSEYWYDWDDKNPLHERNAIERLAPGEFLYPPSQLIPITHPFGKYGSPCPSSLLIRRSSFERVGGFVEAFKPETYQLCEDIAFYTKLYLQVPVYVTSSCSDRYRCHAQSMWHAVKGTVHEEAERRFYFRWLRGYLRSMGVKDPATWRAVRREAWMYWLPLPNFVTRILRRGANRLRRRAAPSE